MVRVVSTRLIARATYVMHACNDRSTTRPRGVANLTFNCNAMQHGVMVVNHPHFSTPTA